MKSFLFGVGELVNKTRWSTLALTPALSPGERENRSPTQTEVNADSGSLVSRKTINVQLLFPRLGGEGQGEGGRQTILFFSSSSQKLKGRR